MLYYSVHFSPVPQYLNEADVAALRVDDCHRVTNTIGGSFDIRFQGHQGDKFIFRNISDGWEQWPPYDFTFDEVRQQVCDIVAGDSCEDCQ